MTRAGNDASLLMTENSTMRAGHKWEPGLEFSVEDLGDSIALKPMRAFKQTKPRDVLGCAQYRGKRRSLKEMEAAIEIFKP